MKPPIGPQSQIQKASARKTAKGFIVIRAPRIWWVMKLDSTACNAKGKSAADDAKVLALISTVSFGVGVVGLGAGTVLLLGASDGGGGTGANVAVRGAF